MRKIGQEWNYIIDGKSGNEKPREGLLARNESESKLGRRYKGDGSATELGSSKQGTDGPTQADRIGAEIDTFQSEIRLSAEFYVTW
jgi:hypothetical protein